MSDRKVLALMTVCGLAAGVAQAQQVPDTGNRVINLTGATLLQPFSRSAASTNDFIDANGDGVAGIFNSFPVQQLATGTGASWPPNLSTPSSFWYLNYRSVGSVNGLQEVINFGTTFVTTDGSAAGQIRTNQATASFWNRTQYVTSQNLTSGGIGNINNPGGAPGRSSTDANRTVTYAASGAAAGGMQPDVAIVDVPASWAVFRTGSADLLSPFRKPLQPSYGNNPRLALNPDGSSTTQSNKLADLGPTANLFDPANPGSANANTLFDTFIVWAPVAAVANFGTDVREITQSDLKHLSATGRTRDGYNFVFTTRDSGSGTRNAFQNAIGVEPSFGAAENIGARNAIGVNTQIGKDFFPTNKNGNADQIETTKNHRLALGYAGAEQAVNAASPQVPGYLTNGLLELVSVKFDVAGGPSAQFVRINENTVVDNNPLNGWIVGGPSVLTTYGDPQASTSRFGGSNNGRPKMRNEWAAEYINNISASLAFFNANPALTENDQMPGDYLGRNLVPIAALDFVPALTNPQQLVANPNLSQSLQDFIKTNSTVFRNSVFDAWGNGTLNSTTRSRAGIVPIRQQNQTYTDGVTGTQNWYLSQGGAQLTYNTNLPLRNMIAGDFNGDGLRNTNDLPDMMRALRQREGGPAWTAPNASGKLLAEGLTVVPNVTSIPGTDASIEILGDFNGDGNYNRADFRYYADGLVIDSGNGYTSRLAGFTEVDNASQAILGNLNFFGTTLATGKAYAAGDSRGDVSNPNITNGTRQATRGHNPIGADGVINNHDIDYVYRQFKNVQGILGVVANWRNLEEAVFFDLSADMDGNLAVNQGDVCALVRGILGTEFGDANLDGSVDALDLALVTANQGLNGGWAQGDFNGDGLVDQLDLDILANPSIVTCCPADYDGTGFVDSDDFSAFVSDFELGCDGAGSPDPACTRSADFDGTGFVDSDDFAAFVEAFEVGCN